MTITRIGTTARWSDVVIHNGTLYVVEVPATDEADIHQQTREVLTSLQRSDNGLFAHLSDGTQVACDVVLSAVGLRPRTAVAAAAGAAGFWAAGLAGTPA